MFVARHQQSLAMRVNGTMLARKTGFDTVCRHCSGALRNFEIESLSKL